MSLLDNLAHLLQGHQQAQPQMHGDPGSGHSVQQLQQRIAYLPQPQKMQSLSPLPMPGQSAPLLQLPQFQAHPGLSIRPPVNGFQQPNPWEDETAGGALQGYNQNDLSQGIQGGMVNQGYIPLQSGYGAAARPIQGGHINRYR